MSKACLSAIAHPINTAAMEQWALVSDLCNVLRPGPQCLTNVGFSNGSLCADDIILPSTDCRVIGAVVVHECDGSAQDGLLWITTTPDVRQEGHDAVICVSGFSLDAHAPKDETLSDQLQITKGMTACERAEILECCLDMLLCGQQKVDVSFSGRRTSFTKASESGLRTRINELYARCEMETGKPAPRMRHSGQFRCTLPNQSHGQLTNGCYGLRD